jgi:N-carbamoylputrescine amidase
MAILRIALLHVAPEVGELERNCRLIEQSVAFAATLGAEWIITPELCLTGYRFLNHLGSDWIRPAADEWTTRIRKTAARFKVTIFLGHLERDNDGQLYNTVFMIGTDGLIIGKHRKVRVVKVAEDWANPGVKIEPINVASVRVGLLICADAYDFPPCFRRRDLCCL